MKIDRFRLLALLVLTLAGCNDIAESNTEFQTFESINRTFSVSKTSNETGIGNNLQTRVINADADDAALWQELEQRGNELAPLFLIYLAEHTFASNERKAIEWYWLGHIRAQLDASLCLDKTAKAGLGFVTIAAPTVLKAIHADRERAAEISQKVLNRKDLRASRASPWWICSHGANSVLKGMKAQFATQMTAEEKRAIGFPSEPDQQTPLDDWLIPENEMAQRYEEIFAEYNTMFDKMLAPYRDPVAMAAVALLPTPISDKEPIESFFWLDDNTLIILRGGRGHALYLRPLIGETKFLSEPSTGLELCVGGEHVTLNASELEVIQFGRTWKQDFLSWSMRDYTLQERQVESHFFSETPKYAAQQSISLTHRNTKLPKHKQSPLSCSWHQVEALGSFAEQASNWSDIAPHPGFLFTASGDGTLHKGTYYLPHATAQPVLVTELLLPLDCMRYVPHRGTILVTACPMSSTENSDSDGWNSGTLVWLEYAEGKLQFVTEEAPRHPAPREITQALPMKAGFVRLLQNHDTPNGPRSGGLYFQSPKGQLQKIWNGWAEKAEVSPDGCQLAFTANYRVARNQRTDEINKLYVANLCEYRDKLAAVATATAANQ